MGRDVVSKIRLERDEALSERDSANGKVTAALEEARQIKRHAELLDETAREIAREAGAHTDRSDAAGSATPATERRISSGRPTRTNRTTRRHLARHPPP
jgi:hypothetical protein